MAMSGSRLQSNLKTDILSQIQTAFPIPSGLQPAEKTALQNAQTAMANAYGNAIGPDVVTEVQNATVPPGIAVATAGGPTNQTGATTAAGTVT